MQATLANKKEEEKFAEETQATVAILSTALSTIKAKAADIHYEQLIGLLASQNVNVGTLSHSR